MFLRVLSALQIYVGIKTFLTHFANYFIAFYENRLPARTRSRLFIINLGQAAYILEAIYCSDGDVSNLEDIFSASNKAKSRDILVKVACERESGEVQFSPEDEVITQSI